MRRQNMSAHVPVVGFLILSFSLVAMGLVVASF
jgi:hypothetical protein